MCKHLDETGNRVGKARTMMQLKRRCEKCNAGYTIDEDVASCLGKSSG
jgi:hypothetical protein